jgi:hypothetical protein
MLVMDGFAEPFDGMRYTANVQKCLYGEYRINRDVADPSLLAGLLEVLGKVGALKSLSVLALPNVSLALWINLKIEPPLFIENIREPGIVPPVGLHDDGVVWLFGPEELVDCVALTSRIPIRAELRSLHPYGRRNSDILRWVNVWTSSTHAILKPSRLLMLSAVASCMP